MPTAGDPTATLTDPVDYGDVFTPAEWANIAAKGNRLWTGVMMGGRTLKSVAVDGIGNQPSGVAPGDILATGAMYAGTGIFSAAGNIIASAGDVVGQVGVQAVTGHVEATIGDVKAPAGWVRGKRLGAVGMALVVGDVTLDANWGAGATVTNIAGDDTHGWVRILAAGIPGANPVWTLTFKEVYTVYPMPQVNMDYGTTTAVADIVPVGPTTDLTKMQTVYCGTPTAGRAYGFYWHLLGME